MICDGTGLSIFYNDVCAIYTAMRHGVTVPETKAPSFLATLAADRDYMASARCERDRLFWQERFASPCESAIPSHIKHAGHVQPTSDLATWVLEREVFDQIEQFVRHHRASTVHFFLALFAAYFARINNLREVVIGLPVHNRTNAAQKRTVGMFVSMIPLRIDVDLDAPFTALMSAVSQELRRCYRHQRLPLGEIRRSAGVHASSGESLFDVSMAFDEFSLDSTMADIVPKVIRVNHGAEPLPLAICINNGQISNSTVIEFSFNEGFSTKAMLKN